jgi:RNA polymerase-binding protein DksA
MAVTTKLSKTDFSEIKESLLDEKKRLEIELAKISQKSPGGANEYEVKYEDVGTDESENVSEVTQYALNLTLEQTLEKSLRDVAKALQSIDKGTYGLCKYCKQPIDKKRLVARPTSTACVSCKTKLKSL